MTSHDIYGAKPGLLLTRYRGGIIWAGREEDDIVAGWITSYRVALVLLWNKKQNQYEILSKVLLN